MKSLKRTSFPKFNKTDKCIWLGSLLLIALSFVLCGEFDIAVLCACLVGATALIFLAKGNPIGQLLTVLFSVLYGYVSLKCRYYGEMITYLGMTAPMALASAVSWYGNPFDGGGSEVKIRPLKKSDLVLLPVCAGLATAVFGVLLAYFNTPNLALSTISVTTSFLAAGLTFLRSSYYAAAYAANDVILIALWVLATIGDRSFLPMISCFAIFLVNDIYGFLSWREMKKRQSNAPDAK